MLNVAPVGRETIDSWPVDGSGLPVRVVNSVRPAGVATVGQLRAQTDHDLLALHSLGRISLNHVRSFFKLCAQIEQGKQSFNSIRELLPLFLDGPEMRVITARYGLDLKELNGATNCATLQEIGAVGANARPGRSDGTDRRGRRKSWDGGGRNDQFELPETWDIEANVALLCDPLRLLREMKRVFRYHS